MNTQANFDSLDREFGTVTFEGKTYWLTEVADFSNRVFDGWFGDAEEGEAYTTEFKAEAIDAEGNEYVVTWQFETVKGNEPEDNGNWPWQNVSFVKPS